MEFIVEALVMFCFIYPGAFLRWMLKGFKGKYSEMANSEDTELNSFFGVLFLVVGVIIANCILS